MATKGRVKQMQASAGMTLTRRDEGGRFKRVGSVPSAQPAGSNGRRRPASDARRRRPQVPEGASRAVNVPDGPRSRDVTVHHRTEGKIERPRRDEAHRQKRPEERVSQSSDVRR